MIKTKGSKIGAGLALLLAGSMLSGVALAQDAPPPPAGQGAPDAQIVPVAPPLVVRTVKSMRVEGSQRIEADTVLSYTKLRVGGQYTTETIDQAIKDLLSSDLLADVQIEGVETGDLIIRIRENPIINRIVFEGNKRLKQDKIDKEIKLQPRQIFTRTAVRADVARIIELYRRQGRFAARVDPQMVMLDQNRVDVVFEITEGPKSKVRQINIIGNSVFSDGELRKQMATKQARFTRLLSSNTSFDQDRLTYDQQKLRLFYLTEGYAEFRVISAVAELTPDKQDFIITYVVEEGPRYKFGDVEVDSQIRDFDSKKVASGLPMKKGDWYNGKQVEDAIDQLTQLAGTFGYAFADVRPEIQRDKDKLEMNLNFVLGEANRTYVERVDITGNTQTQDKVIRREMRIAEGDAFNQFLVKRSEDRINSLGYFQDKFKIDQKQGSTPDRVVLAANVEEKSTGQLSLSAGYSSLERFIFQGSIEQRNFRGKGQDARLSVSYSTYSKSIELGFTEPYLFDKTIALGGTIFRRDYNSFNYIGTQRNTTYSQVSTGFNIVSAIPLTEYWTLRGAYTFSKDNITLDQATFYTNGVCDPLKAGRYLCDAIGDRLTSSVSLSLIFNNLNSGIRPTRGQRLTITGDIAGLGGDVRYARLQLNGSKYWDLGKNWIVSLTGEGGYIHSLEKSRGAGSDPVLITNRFYLGEPQFHGFDIRGVGPRVQRLYYSSIDSTTGNQVLNTDRNQIVDDPLGGKTYYLATLELQPPLGSGAAELGLRPSIYLQAGALFNITRPVLQSPQATDSLGNLLYITKASDGTYVSTTDSVDVNGNPNTPQLLYQERFLGDTPKPRVTVGIGVNWNSPFGPLRIDIAKDLISQRGDDSKLVTFNVGTSF